MPGIVRQQKIKMTDKVTINKIPNPKLTNLPFVHIDAVFYEWGIDPEDLIPSLGM